MVAVHANNLQEPTDAFIDEPIEGQKTILKINPDSLTAMSVFRVLQWDFKSRLLLSYHWTSTLQPQSKKLARSYSVFQKTSVL